MTVTAAQIRLSSYTHTHAHKHRYTHACTWSRAHHGSNSMFRGVDGKCGAVASAQCVIQTDERDQRNPPVSSS